MTKICPQENRVDAQYINMWGQEWIYWKCDAKFKNILYQDNKPIQVKDFNYMLNQGSYTLWSHQEDAKWYQSLCNLYPIVGVFGDQMHTTCNTFNTFNSNAFTTVAFSVSRHYEHCLHNRGHFEILLTKGHAKTISDIQESVGSQSKAIDDVSKAFHELIGKFAALERQQDKMQEDFSDFKSYMCTGKER